MKSEMIGMKYDYVARNEDVHFLHNFTKSLLINVKGKPHEA